MKAQAITRATTIASPIRPNISPHDGPSGRVFIGPASGVACGFESFSPSVTTLVYGCTLPQAHPCHEKGRRQE